MVEEVIYKRYHNGTVVVLSLNRPKQLNAVNHNMLTQLRGYLDQLSKDQSIEVLIIKSELHKAFCSGIDVSYVRELSNEEASNFFEDIADTLECLINFPVPTIAVVQGYAFGAGADIALACSLRVASESTQFRFPGTQFGVILGTQRLVNEVGYSKGRMLALTGETLDAKASLQAGLIHKLVDSEDCLNTALSWAGRVIRMPKYTLDNIQKICTVEKQLNLKAVTSKELAKHSIIDGDFNTRFDEYLNQMNKNKQRLK